MTCGGYNELHKAVTEMLDARAALEAAPTGNGRAFDEAMSRHTTALERLSELTAFTHCAFCDAPLGDCDGHSVAELRGAA